MKYILDFDRVIFDSDAYIKTVKTRRLDSLFVDPKIWDILSVRDYLYPDALDFLRAQDRESMTVITAMSPQLGPNARAYQRRKLADSGIAEFVRDVIIMEGEKGPYVRDVYDGAETIFVDDTLSNLHSVQRSCSEVRCVQMLRIKPVRAEEVSENPDIPVVQSFSGLSAMIGGV